MQSTNFTETKREVLVSQTDDERLSAAAKEKHNTQLKLFLDVSQKMFKREQDPLSLAALLAHGDRRHGAGQ
jgi:hypothetical protein